MNKYLLTAALVALTGSAFAVGPFGPPKGLGVIWGCNPPLYPQSSTGNVPQSGIRWCRTAVTSATTTTALSVVNINPAQHVYVSMGVSSTTAATGGIAGVVTPTLILSLGGKVVSQINVSATTIPNLVDLGLVPYFDAITISQSQPSLISGTSAILPTIIGNDK